jgi:hypothetical protein
MPETFHGFPRVSITVVNGGGQWKTTKRRNSLISKYAAMAELVDATDLKYV